MKRAWLHKERIVSAVAAGSQAGLEEIGGLIADEARRLAPIRKVFRERVRKFRPLTEEEQEAAIAMARRYYSRPTKHNKQHLAFLEWHIRNLAKVELRVPGQFNYSSRARQLRVLGYERGGRFRGIRGATRSGYPKGYMPGPSVRELMKGRAIREARLGKSIYISPKGRVQMGGKLRASIRAMPPLIEGSKVRVEVVAGIYYAKFVEFPTVRTAAQPFLRPAMKQYQVHMARIVAPHIRRSLEAA